jgi:hypothetical protein
MASPDSDLLARVTAAVEFRGGKRRGDEWRMLCPFHEEDTPSFDWNAEKGVYHCLGCGAQGGAVELARKIGVDLANGRRSSVSGSSRRERPRLREVEPDKEPATPLPSADDLADARALLVDGRSADAATARKYLQRIGIDPAGCGWGLANDGRHPQFLIPIYGHAGDLVNVRRYAGPFPGPKCMSWATGYGAATAYRFDAAAAAADWLLWCEGEKDCEAARAHGLTAVSFTNGAKAAAKVIRELPGELLAGKRHTLLFDADKAGRDGAAAAAGALLNQGAAEVRIASWPEGTAEGGDVSDWFAGGGTAEGLQAILDQAATVTPKAAKAASALIDDDVPERRSQATMLLDLVAEFGAEPFRDMDGGFWLAAPESGHTAALPIGERGGGVSRYLRRAFQQQFGRPPSSTAVSDASAMLAAQAEVGSVRPVHVRIAGHGGRVYLDLNRSDWRVVEVTTDGWTVVPCPADLHFRRPLDAQPLPHPDPKGSMDALHELLGERMEQQARIVIGCWLLGAMQPGAPYPVLNLNGERGTGKSTVARLLVSPIDPSGGNRDGTVGAPKDEDALIVRAVSRHIVALDNLSRITPELSDAICRLSTGGPVSRRRLYTDFEEAVVYLRRPVILTGIGDIVRYGDLADRCLTVSLPFVPEDERIPEAVVWKRADALMPSILGGLLTAASAALRHRGDVTGPLPRMADWSTWCIGAAIGGAVPWDESAFRDALFETREAATEAVLDASPLPNLIVELLEAVGGSLDITAEDLLDRLSFKADEKTTRHRSWPADATRLSGKLREIAPAMRDSLRVDMSQRKSNGRRLWRIERLTAVQGDLFDAGDDEAEYDPFAAP